MNEIILGGCTPTPLAGYLKALGVLRLLSARYPETRAAWRNEALLLATPLTREQIEAFFLREYQPSALVTPWNGRGGFLEGEDGDEEASSRAGALMVRAFSDEAAAGRFQNLAHTLQRVGRIPIVDRLNAERAKLKLLAAAADAKERSGLSDSERSELARQDAVVKDIKARMLQELRNVLPDEVLPWFDTCLALVGEQSSGERRSVPSPLLGAGGLDGSMDFGVNYLRRLNDVFAPDTGAPREGARGWLTNAIFGDTASGLYSTSPQDKKAVSVGQFSPYRAGGYNADNGPSGRALLNPWDTILQLEGAVLFAASAARRLGGSGDASSSLPFTASAWAIGEVIAFGDEVPKRAKRRTAEMWLPLWKGLASCQELEGVFREGRITIRGSAAVSGFDCARAVASLGSDRGIEQFQRFVFLKRSGDAFFALEKGRFSVRDSALSGLVDELEDGGHFLSRLHDFVRSRTNSGDWNAGPELRAMAKRLDDLLVSALHGEDGRALRAALLLSGRIHLSIASSAAARQRVPPAPQLSERWVKRSDGGTTAFRIARALAGLRGAGDEPFPLRAQILPVHPRFPRWAEEACKSRSADGDPACRVRICSRRTGPLVDVLSGLLERRLWLADRLEVKNRGAANDKPLDSPAGATLGDVAAFLQSDSMDRSIAALLPGLSLCDIPRDEDRPAGDGALPAAFALLKLCFTPNSILRNLGVLERDRSLPVPPGILAQLASGYGPERAVFTAWRRLRASGLNPAFTLSSLPSLAGTPPRRVAAALLIPLRYGAYRKLARSVLQTPGPAGGPAA